MKRVLLCALVLSAAFCLSYGQNDSGVINVSAAYLYSKPDYESSLETQELMGVIVKLGERDRYWIKVDTPQPYTAWLTDRSIVPMDSTMLAAYEAAPKCIVTAVSSRVADRTGKKSAQVCDLVTGDILRLNCGGNGKPLRKGSDVAVVLPDGRTGWVNAADVASVDEWRRRTDAMSASQKVETAVSYAMKMLGTPYLWGGMTTKGADCSGLVRLAYMMAGVTLPRNVSQIVKCCRPVPMDGIRRGDLLFFGSDGRATHVAVYLGDGKIIHSSHLVRINSIRPGDADCYENIEKLMSAGRVVE